ncbi:MAG: thymidine phosphorylase, partial [Proteobacteria bacterium]|nr:thymidine phosphorylase [Pseudomonadota bacterium]MBU1582412.1 thymidine phosphorylase [Pseudomonadota bacterium]MBU2456070.1 thymidine phosphorylase [Pseudomonadota bacterium]
DIPDYQISSLLMAIWFSKMDARETAYLTFAMRDSGDVFNLSDIAGIKADKHSTGGVADTTTLIVAPMVAACGLKVAKMSGRGLGHTGGTLDKLESIPGFSTDIAMERFKQIVSECGMSIIGQTNRLVPADKMLYALRDVTGTVDNTSLIAASIMSKKLALGSDVIVLDVKTGNGAFMKSIEDAKALAESMVAIGKMAKKNIMALVTDMNQPLGNAIGNALEVQEAIEILQGKYDGDLKTVSLALAAKMLIAGGISKDDDAALKKLNQALSSGKALKKLEQMIIAQGGNPVVCQNIGVLPKADRIIPVKADKTGYIGKILTDQVGICALLLGAGRVKKTDAIDPGVGIWMNSRLGAFVEKNDIIAHFHVNDTKNLDLAIQRFQTALVIEKKPPDMNPLIHGAIA